MILILTATAQEQATLRGALHNASHRRFAHRHLHEGILDGRTVCLLETGIGCVNAAQSLTAFLESQEPRAVLQTGIGGAYAASGLSVGDIAIADAEAYADAGVVTPDGWHGLDLIGIPLLGEGDGACYNTIPVDRALVSKAAAVLAGAFSGVTVRTGPFATVQQCSGVGAIGDAVASRFTAICENMEGAAAAHVCCLYGVPFLEIRAISNLVEDRDISKWEIPRACGRAQEAAVAVIPHLSAPHF